MPLCGVINHAQVLSILIWPKQNFVDNTTGGQKANVQHFV